MIVLGLTGGIAMGKTTVASQFASLGAKVICADAIVHALLAPGGAGVGSVGALFPEAVEGDHISRQKLGKRVFGDELALSKLEDTLHPLVIAEENRFIDEMSRNGARLVVLDIPLLFETGGEHRCDVTVTVSAPYYLQRRRALMRPGMTVEKFSAILARQLTDVERRLRAHFTVHTGLGRAYSFHQVKRIVKELQ